MTVQFRRAVAALVLALTAGCQGPAESADRGHVWVGTLPRRETGFDQRTWQDTSAGTVRQLMARLPDRIDSVAEHRLARNLLISIADAPQGEDDGGAILALRIGALMRFGDVSDAAALARAARNPPGNAAAQLEIEAELLAGNVEMACIDLRALAASSLTRWAEDGLALCKARAGEAGATPHDTGGLGALARIGGAALPADPPSGEPAGTRIAYLAAVGEDPKAAPARRLEAAFVAARASALRGDAYARLLRSAPVRGQSPGGGPPVTGEQAAALFQAIGGSADPGRKLALAEQGLLSSDGAVDGVGAAMTAPLRAVKPEPALAPLAGRFAALFYAVGNTKAAAPWADLAKRSGPDMAAWPYRALLKPPASGELAAWGKKARLDPARQDRIAAILSAFDAAPETSDAGQDDLREIDRAAARQHVGETTLRALVLLGPEGPAGADTQTLYHVLGALDRINLHDEARAIACEAIAGTVLAHPRRGEAEASIPNYGAASAFRSRAMAAGRPRTVMILPVAS